MINLSIPIIGTPEIKSVVSVLRSGYIVQGSKTKELEERFAAFCETKYAVAVSNGTAALHTALLAAGIGFGDEVITTPFTFIATVNAILMVGARPVFVDIDEYTFNIDPEEIAKKINRKTKAIIAVDLYGQPADFYAINRIAEKFGLRVIEDAAQAVNATYLTKKTGNLGDIGCFSFYATKNLMSGEGGMITTNDKKIYEQAKLLRHHGQSEKVRYQYNCLGFNYRMTDIQSALALSQLDRIDELTLKRQKIAGIYNEAFGKIPGLIIPMVAKEATHVYHQYTLRVTKDFRMSRDELKEYLQRNGIQSGIYYPLPLYTFSHIRKSLENNKNIFPKTKLATTEVLSIPVHPLLTKKDIIYICAKIKYAKK